MYVAGTDDHDEEGVLISDVFTSSAVRRKSQEKRMRKMEALARDLPPPELEGPQDADVTLIGWGSTTGAIREACALLSEEGIRASHLQIKYLHPFHSREVSEILRAAKKTICVECNYSGQFARHLRAETGITVDDMILKYDGEPFEPLYIVEQVRAIIEGRERSTDLTEEESREVAYHYIRVHLKDKARPVKFERIDGADEALWLIELAGRESGMKEGELRIGASSGSIYSWQPTQASSAGAD
jgi:pyruvate/2-oxoacid:ferredoxin oxidoreductase alpha subunit